MLMIYINNVDAPTIEHQEVLDLQYIIESYEYIYTYSVAEIPYNRPFIEALESRSRMTSSCNLQQGMVSIQ